MALTQRVVSSHFPYLPLRLQIRESAYQLQALLDTGFDGYVTVPPELMVGDQPADGHEIWRLADGSEVLTPWYRGSVSIGDLAPVSVVVIELGDEPLIGRGVADGFNVILDHGRRVIVEP